MKQQRLEAQIIYMEEEIRLLKVDVGLQKRFSDDFQRIGEQWMWNAEFWKDNYKRSRRRIDELERLLEISRNGESK